MFSIAISGNIAKYLHEANTDFHWHYNFHLVSIAATTIVIYVIFVPFALWAAFKWTVRPVDSDLITDEVEFFLSTNLFFSLHFQDKISLEFGFSNLKLSFDFRTEFIHQVYWLWFASMDIHLAFIFLCRFFGWFKLHFCNGRWCLGRHCQPVLFSLLFWVQRYKTPIDLFF